MDIAVSVSHVVDCPDSSWPSDVLDAEKQRIVQKKKEQLFALLEEEPEMHHLYSSDCDVLRSRATLGISQIQIPLAWNGEQHFAKGESRTYSMFYTVQTKSGLFESKIIANINRLDTDVAFPESFVFQNEADDFCIELCVYAARTDAGNDNSGSLRQRISRSFGKKFGLQVKSQLQDQRRQIPETIGGTDLAGPPLYGHVLCRLVCLPHSVLHPLADGILTVRPKHSDSVFQHVRCRLQAGVLRCFVNNDVRLKPGNEQTLHRIVITPGSRVTPCNLDDSVVLLIEPTTDSPMLQYILTSDSKHIADSWATAIEHQLNDAIIWGEFAYVHTRLSLNRPREAIDGTIPRDRSSRLYDTINISGSLSKAFMGSTGYNSGLPIGLRKALADQNGGARTAPAPKKNRIRTNVKEIFKDQPPTRGAAAKQSVFFKRNVRCFDVPRWKILVEKLRIGIRG
ncbi:unnamed protein product, partial [Mesorhabditis spiculigera]